MNRPLGIPPPLRSVAHDVARPDEISEMLMKLAVRDSRSAQRQFALLHRLLKYWQDNSILRTSTKKLALLCEFFVTSRKALSTGCQKFFASDVRDCVFSQETDGGECLV
jgi:hypothetical protein